MRFATDHYFAWLCDAALWRRSNHACRSSCSSFLRRVHHSGHSHDVAGCHRDLEVLIDAFESAVDGLPNTANRLAPAEVFLDALSDHLADGVTRVSRRSTIDGTAASASVVARHMRCHATLSAGIDEVAPSSDLRGTVRPRSLMC